MILIIILKKISHNAKKKQCKAGIKIYKLNVLSWFFIDKVEQLINLVQNMQ